LSIREGARCQSFPDWFYFLGSTDEKRLQIGNAVPPLLGKAIGVSILNSIRFSKK
jgi:DNA (cytosine-5)-methyltransferase 1